MSANSGSNALASAALARITPYTIPAIVPVAVLAAQSSSSLGRGGTSSPGLTRLNATSMSTDQGRRFANDSYPARAHPLIISLWGQERQHDLPPNMHDMRDPGTRCGAVSGEEQAAPRVRARHVKSARRDRGVIARGRYPYRGSALLREGSHRDAVPAGEAAGGEVA